MVDEGIPFKIIVSSKIAIRLCYCPKQTLEFKMGIRKRADNLGYSGYTF